jgi:hypothetical protein
VAVAGCDYRVGIRHDPGGQGVARAQHSNRIRTTALHHIQVEACRKNGFPTGQYHDRTVRLGPIERSIDFAKDLRREGIALAVVDAHGGNLPIKAVLNGFRCH